MKTKNLLLGIFLGIFITSVISILPNSVSATDYSFSKEDPEIIEYNSTPTFRVEEKEYKIVDEETYWDNGNRYQVSPGATQGSRKKQDVTYNPDVAGSKKFQSDNLILTIRKAINWVLGILSFIALALWLWGGFQMMISGWDSKKYEAWINLLKRSAIGLAVIAVSWLVISLVFYVINGAITITST